MAAAAAEHYDNKTKRPNYLCYPLAAAAEAVEAALAFVPVLAKAHTNTQPHRLFVPAKLICGGGEEEGEETETLSGAFRK